MDGDSALFAADARRAGVDVPLGIDLLVVNSPRAG